MLKVLASPPLPPPFIIKIFKRAAVLNELCREHLCIHQLASTINILLHLPCHLSSHFLSLCPSVHFLFWNVFQNKLQTLAHFSLNTSSCISRYFYASLISRTILFIRFTVYLSQRILEEHYQIASFGHTFYLCSLPSVTQFCRYFTSM